MATIESITNVRHDTFPGGSIPYGGTCVGSYTYGPLQPGSVPLSTTLYYNPIEVTTSTYDPTKGSGSWKSVKKSGTIKMTPYSRTTQKVEEFPVSRPYKFQHWRRQYAYCGSVCGGVHSQGPIERSWTQNDVISSLSSLIHEGVPSSVRSNYEDEIRIAISTTQQAAYAKALSTYDLLTELGEAKETLKFLQSKVKGAADSLLGFSQKDWQAWQEGRSSNAKSLMKSSSKALRRLGGRWMEYRYALMPLIYSMRDINEILAKRDAVYKTERDRETVRASYSFDEQAPAPWGQFLYDLCEYECEVRSTVKLGYNRGALQRVFAQTVFNPFKTAWELIPLSFVVDWFINVNDVITSATSLNLASQTACCTSLRRRETFSTFLYDATVDTSFASWAATVCYDASSVSSEHQRNVNAILKRVTVDSYSRFIWSKPRPELHFDVFLNWKRFLDGLVLSNKPISKLLRSLK